MQSNSVDLWFFQFFYSVEIFDNFSQELEFLRLFRTNSIFSLFDGILHLTLFHSKLRKHLLNHFNKNEQWHIANVVCICIQVYSLCTHIDCIVNFSQAFDVYSAVGSGGGGDDTRLNVQYSACKPVPLFPLFFFWCATISYNTSVHSFLFGAYILKRGECIIIFTHTLRAISAKLYSYRILVMMTIKLRTWNRLGDWIDWHQFQKVDFS